MKEEREKQLLVGVVLGKAGQKTPTALRLCCRDSCDQESGRW